MSSSPIVNLHKSLSTDSLHLRSDVHQRLSLQHIFNSCVLDKHQRVNAGELVRHFRFVAEQNADLLTVQFDFTFLLQQLGGSDQQVTFDQLFAAVEKLYSQLIDKSEQTTSTPVSKSISSMSLHASSSSKKQRDKENIDSQTSDDASNSFGVRRKSHEHEKCKIECNELVELNRRQTERIHMLEEEYKKLEDDAQRLQIQCDELVKKKLTLEDDLNRSTRYANENVDLHVYKDKLETSQRDLKEEIEYCEREKFELNEQIADMEVQIKNFREERDHYLARLISLEHELNKEMNFRQKLEQRLNETQSQLKESNQIIDSMKINLDDLNLSNQEKARQNVSLAKNTEELREQLRNARTESIEARLSLSNLCDEESFLCDELEERVDVSRRTTIVNGQSLFAEINTIETISNECVSQCLDSSNMEMVDDMEVQILLSKTDTFNSIYLKDVFQELHLNGVDMNEQMRILSDNAQCEDDREHIRMTSYSIERHISTIKNLIKKVIDNKDVFEGRFRKLQVLLLASREKQQKFQLELREFADSARTNLTSSNLVSILREYHNEIDRLRDEQRMSDEKINMLEETLTKTKADETAQRLKCIFLTKQMKKMTHKAKEKREQIDEHEPELPRKIRSRRNLPLINQPSNLTMGICPFHSVRELLRYDDELFNSTSALLPCRCLTRSRSSPTMAITQPPSAHIRRLSSPSVAPVMTTDSGLSTSTTGCTTSRSPTPDSLSSSASLSLEIDSLLNMTLTKESDEKSSVRQRSIQKCNRSIVAKIPTRTERIWKKLQWGAIVGSCLIVAFLWSVAFRYYCLTSPNDDDCGRLSFAWWPFAYCSKSGITL